MRYKNEVGYRSLELYADHEHVITAKDLLSEILKQLDTNCTKDGLHEYDVADHAVAGLIQLVMDVAEDNGYHQLMHDLQDIAVEKGLSHLI